jgi:thiamine phosphate synthase YjbQ (UPF0047 family)
MRITASVFINDD